MATNCIRSVTTDDGTKIDITVDGRTLRIDGDASTPRTARPVEHFPLSASISAIHHWMPVWSRKTVSAQCSPHLRISGSCPGFFGVVMLSGSTAHTCAPCGLPAVSEPPALVSFVLACDGASFAPTPRLLGASLPLRRYV